MTKSVAAYPHGNSGMIMGGGTLQSIPIKYGKRMLCGGKRAWYQVLYELWQYSKVEANTHTNRIGVICRGVLTYVTKQTEHRVVSNVQLNRGSTVLRPMSSCLYQPAQ